MCRWDAVDIGHVLNIFANPKEANSNLFCFLPKTQCAYSHIRMCRFLKCPIKTLLRAAYFLTIFKSSKHNTVSQSKMCSNSWCIKVAVTFIFGTKALYLTFGELPVVAVTEGSLETSKIGLKNHLPIVYTEIQKVCRVGLQLWLICIHVLSAGWLGGTVLKIF